jgi:hypothetical protein
MKMGEKKMGAPPFAAFCEGWDAQLVDSPLLTVRTRYLSKVDRIEPNPAITHHIKS